MKVKTLVKSIAVSLTLATVAAPALATTDTLSQTF